MGTVIDFPHKRRVFRVSLRRGITKKDGGISSGQITPLVLPPPEFSSGKVLMTRSEAEAVCFVWRCGFPCKMSFAQNDPRRMSIARLIYDISSLRGAVRFFFGGDLLQVSVSPINIENPRKRFDVKIVAKKEGEPTITFLACTKKSLAYPVTNLLSRGYNVYLEVEGFPHSFASRVRSAENLRWLRDE